MKSIFYLFFSLLFVPKCIAQKVNITFLSDTLELQSIFKNMNELEFPKRINDTTLVEFYANIYISHHDVDEKFDKKMFNINLQLGDIYFSHFIYEYIDKICIDCSQNKKNFFYWYIMNYYYIPTAMLYRDTVLCPCLIKKIQFPDAQTFVFGADEKLSCIETKPVDRYNYKIYKYNPFFPNIEKFVYGWYQIIPNNKMFKTSLLKKSFKFVYNDSTYCGTITFDSSRFNYNIPHLGKDASIIKQKLDYHIDTSLISFLTYNTKKLSSEEEKINFLLSFVQQSINYETDINLLSVEDKTLLPEETLYRGKGDCEDRSFLLAYLIKRILNKKNIIIIIYDGHVNVGVNIRKKYNTNAFIKYKGKKYFICEPSSYLPIGSDLIPVKKEFKIIKL